MGSTTCGCNRETIYERGVVCIIVWLVVTWISVNVFGIDAVTGAVMGLILALCLGGCFNVLIQKIFEKLH